MNNWTNMKIGYFLKERESRIKPVEANKMNLKRIEKITQEGEIFLSNTPSNTDMILVKKGDLVISGIGIAKGGGNSLNIYEGKEDILATIHYSSYILNEKIVSREFLKIFLTSSYFRMLLKENSPGGIKAEIKAKHILPIEIKIPSLPIQADIIKKINSVKEEIKELEINLGKNKIYISKLHQAILQEAVQGKLVPQDPKDEPASELLKKIKMEKEKLIKEGRIKKQKPLPLISEDEIPYELPKSWEWVRLGEICTLISDGSHNPPIGIEKGIPMISATNVLNDKILFNEKLRYISEKEYELERKRNPIEKGDVLFTIVGTIGRTTVVNITSKFCLQRSVALIKSRINPQYLSYYLRSPLILKEFIERGKGTAQKGIYLGKLKETLLPLPPLLEQIRIVEKVDKLMNYCDELEKQIKENQENSEKLMEVVLRESFNY